MVNPFTDGTMRLGMCRDLAHVEQMLMGKKPGERIAHFLRFYNNGNMCTTNGGFCLLQRYKHAFLLDMDRSMTGSALTDHYRAEILKLIDKLEKKGKLALPVIPVGRTALYSGVGRRRTQDAIEKLKPVARQGNEAVFSLRPWTPPDWPQPKDPKERHFYLSGYDTQEDPPLYFLCRLPRPVRSVDEAREALKPASVRKAEALGLRVKRQGDLFAIETSFTLEDTGLEIQRYPGAPPARPSLVRENWGGAIVTVVVASPSPSIPLPEGFRGFYGTAHTATESVQLDNGVWLGSGTMIHNPRLVGELRRPDHSPLELGDKAWWIIKNTVPIQGPANTRIRQYW